MVDVLLVIDMIQISIDMVNRPQDMMKVLHDMLSLHDNEIVPQEMVNYMWTQQMLPGILCMLHIPKDMDNVPYSMVKSLCDIWYKFHEIW
jgi:hypothetical protein